MLKVDPSGPWFGFSRMTQYDWVFFTEIFYFSSPLFCFLCAVMRRMRRVQILEFQLVKWHQMQNHSCATAPLLMMATAFATIHAMTTSFWLCRHSIHARPQVPKLWDNI